jgi:hypothetical protein
MTSKINQRIDEARMLESINAGMHPQIPDPRLQPVQSWVSQQLRAYL